MDSQEYKDYITKALNMFTLFLAFMFLIALLALILSLVSMPPPTSVEHREYEDTSTSGHNKEIETGFSLALAQTENCCPSCANNCQSAEEERNEFISSKRNLNAQEGVWRASNAMAYLTAIASFIGIAGLYLLNNTLRATRDGADASINAGRAFLEVQCETNILRPSEDSADMSDAPTIEPNRVFSVDVYVFNHGKTPANVSSITITFVDEKSGEKLSRDAIYETGGTPYNWRNKTEKDFMVWPDKKAFIYEAAWLPTFRYFAARIHDDNYDPDNLLHSADIIQFETLLLALKVKFAYTGAFEGQKVVEQLITFHPHVPILEENKRPVDWIADRARPGGVSFISKILTQTTYIERTKDKRE